MCRNKIKKLLLRKAWQYTATRGSGINSHVGTQHGAEDSAEDSAILKEGIFDNIQRATVLKKSNIQINLISC